MPFQRRVLAVVVVTALYWAQCTNAASETIHGTSIKQPASNISLAAFPKSEVPDARPNDLFHAAIILGDVVLPYLPLLLIGVEALAALAWKNYRAYSLASYMEFENIPGVAIKIVPHDKYLGVTNEVAVRCILFGMHHAAKYQIFRNATIDCFWSERRVAMVLFEEPRNWVPSYGYRAPSVTAKGVETPFTLSAQSACAAARPSMNTTCTVNTTRGDVHPHYFFDRHSREISILAVFMTVMVALEYFSFLESTAQLTSYRSIKTAWDTSMSFHADEKRIEPPFCDYGWLIETVRQIPKFMLRQNKFAEISFAIIVEGVPVGTGLLEKGRPI